MITKRLFISLFYALIGLLASVIVTQAWTNPSANPPLGSPGPIPIGNGGTAATTAATARSNLGAAASGANSDITSLTGTSSITVSGASATAIFQSDGNNIQIKAQTSPVDTALINMVNAAGDLRIGYNTSNTRNIVFQNQGTGGVNVGIGTASPAAQLSVVGGGQAALSGTTNPYGVYIYHDTATGIGYFDVVTGSTSNTQLALRTYNNGTYNTVIRGDQDGNVGIGASPGVALDVSRTSADAYIRAQTTSSGNAALELLTNGNQTYDLIADRTNNRLTVKNTVYTFQTMDAGTGNVGVGGVTTNYAKFRVTGTETAVGTTARGVFVDTVQAAAAANDALYGQFIDTTFNKGALTGVGEYGLRIRNTLSGTGGSDVQYGLYIDSVAGAATNYVAYLGTASTDTVVVGGGSGKLNVGTVDPIYTIGGEKYATYLPSMTGVKEETAGTVNLDNSETYVFDFSKAEKGSNLWLFYQITDFGKNWENLSVILTPEFNGRVWYKKYPSLGKLEIHGDLSGEVSYRLTAPRFDHTDWSNVSANSDGGFVLNPK